MYVQMAFVEHHPDAPLAVHIILNIGVVALSVFTAWAAFKLYDEPVREWLKGKLFTRVKKA